MSTFSTKGGLYERAQKKFKLNDGKMLFTYSFFDRRRLEAQVRSLFPAGQGGDPGEPCAAKRAWGRLKQHFACTASASPELRSCHGRRAACTSPAALHHACAPPLSQYTPLWPPPPSTHLPPPTSHPQAFFADIYLEATRAQPAPGHYALSALLDAGRLHRHYTLNIDGLAGMVGMDSWDPDANPGGERDGGRRHQGAAHA